MKRAVSSMLMMFVGLSASAVGQQPAAKAQPKATPVGQLTFSRDGRWLAVAYEGNDSLMIWDTLALVPIYKARAKAPIRSIAFSPTADILAIACGTSVKILDPKVDRVLREVDGNQGPVHSVRFGRDGSWIATGGGDGTVKLWNLASGEVAYTFSGPKGLILDVSISPDEKLLAAACGNRDTVFIWNLERLGDKPRKLEFPIGRGYQGEPSRPADVPQVAFSPDSHYVVTPDKDRGRISCFDVASGKEAIAFISTNGWTCVSVSTDGRWLAAVPNYGGPIRLVRCDQSSGDEQDRQIASLIKQFHDDDYAKREAATQQLAALGPMAVEQLRSQIDSPDAEVRVRSRRLVERILNLTTARKLDGHEADPTRVMFSPDSKLLATGDSAGIVKLWMVAEGQVTTSLLPDGNAIKLIHETGG